MHTSISVLCDSIVVFSCIGQEASLSDGKSHLPLEITRHAGMNDAWHLLPQDKLVIGKNESVMLVFLSCLIQGLPLLYCKCLTTYIVVQLQEYTCRINSQSMLAIESTEHTLTP